MNENEFFADQCIAWTNAFLDSKLSKSKVVKTGFSYIYRRYEYLKSTKVLASKAALEKFEEVFGSNYSLTKCDWNTKLSPIVPGYSECKKNDQNKFKKYLVRKVLYWEHFDTAYDFKNELIQLYKIGGLNKTNVLTLLDKKRMCWITREENEGLNSEFKIKRVDPKKAYEMSKIRVIY